MAYSTTLDIVKGDTRPLLTFTVRDSNTAAAGKTLDANDSTTWAAIDLTGATVHLRTRAVGSTTIVKDITCSLVDATNGKVSAQFPTGSWTAAGLYEGELEITFSDGGIQTVVELIKFKVRDSFD